MHPVYTVGDQPEFNHDRWLPPTQTSYVGTSSLAGRVAAKSHKKHNVPPLRSFPQPEPVYSVGGNAGYSAPPPSRIEYVQTNGRPNISNFDSVYFCFSSVLLGLMALVTAVAFVILVL